MKISIPFTDYEIKAVRSGGAGGQHVNKVSTRVELYFNVAQSSVLTDEQKERVLVKLQSKITEDGILRLTEDTSRSQHTNREAIVKKLHEIIAKALQRPKKRVATKIPKSVKRKRLDSKKKKGEIKKLRKRDFD
jgi:ribosome-associated protein